ncbi:MAG TPA: GNAT family N-acetyltransferase [Acidobacteriaceae bacterium]|nr:GNAT family N-acetyltransferase [Acidobacteriaceae bacterium]
MTFNHSVQITSSLEMLSPDTMIVEIDPWKDSRWEAFVLSHPDATIYHHPVWLKVLEREYRQRSLFLACQDADGRLQGVFPLLYTRGLPLSRGPLTGPRLSSLPRTPLAGPLATDRAVLAALVLEARSRATMHAVRLQIKVQTDQLNEGVEGVVRKPWRQNYVVPLAGIPGQPYQVPGGQNRSSIKRSINKAVASGVRTRAAETEDDLRIWYRLYLETMRRNVVPARPYRFFLALWDLMRPTGMMRLLLAEQQTATGFRIVGGHLFFAFGSTVTYAFGASCAADFSVRPNDIIMGQAINDASVAGYRFVDLGEVPEGDNDLARFKSKWGAEPVRLYRYYYPDFPDAEHSSDKAPGSALVLARKIWSRLPLSMTSWLGHRIYTYL